MTPTRSQLDAALPRVPSGIGAMSGDLTDPDERAVALDWLCELVGKATSYDPAWPPPRAYPPAPGITYHTEEAR